jgi:ubiquinone/menaquinone biosynthesis C-methylase UbiE
LTSWKHKRSVKKRYDSTAQIYDARYKEEQEAKYRAAIENLTLSMDSVVLDAGCGSGLLFEHLANKVATVVGIDISRQLLQIAKPRSKQNASISLVQADADHLPFREETFNILFAFTILQNMPKPTKTLNELKSVARKGAYFVVTGLKAAIPLEDFAKSLDQANLQVVSLRDDERLRCNILTCINRQT